MFRARGVGAAAAMRPGGLLLAMRPAHRLLRVNALSYENTMTEAFICDYIRTPIGRFGGSLSPVRADDLGAIPLKALVERNGAVDWEAVDDVVFGCANQAGEDNRNVARMAVRLA